MIQTFIVFLVSALLKDPIQYYLPNLGYSENVISFLTIFLLSLVSEIIGFRPTWFAVPLSFLSMVISICFIINETNTTSYILPIAMVITFIAVKTYIYYENNKMKEVEA